MIISSSITIGQITLVLRVAIQILSYVGLGLISIITLASVSRVAPIDTHDTINRIVGASTATFSTVKWIFDRLCRKHADPAPSTNLFLLLMLSVWYTIFISLSDVGFLGFYACSIPYADSTDFPASVNSSDAARALIVANIVNGTDLSNIKAYRCDSSGVVDLGDIFQKNCTSWHNSTYADSEFFGGLNSSDSDVMMPRQLTHWSYQREAIFDLNAFYIGPNTQRLLIPTIQKGLAIEPHSTGVRMVAGVPQLMPDKKVNIPLTMAVEVDVGCMTLGVHDSKSMSDIGKVHFSTNGTWRSYTGPDYMENILSKTVDDIRSYLYTFFDPATLDANGTLTSINSTNLVLSDAANVGTYDLPSIGFDESPARPLMGNCTAAMQRRLGISYNATIDGDMYNGDMCKLLGVGGSIGVDGFAGAFYSRMVCATATQVNMVNATVDVDSRGNVALNLTRLPSDLNFVISDYWDMQPSASDNITRIVQFEPYQRYTLSANANSPTTHFIHHSNTPLTESSLGPGSAGNAIASIGHQILGFDLRKEYSGLGLLDEGLNRVEFTTDQVTKWVGEVGGSLFIASLGYNGWSALQSAPIHVLSTGGRLGTCYKPRYAIGFVPLIFSTAVVFIWMFLNILSGSWSGTKVLDEVYGGVAPYTTLACPGASPKNTVLAWEASPQPRLQVIQKGYPLTGDAHATALKYLKSAPSYPERHS
ncbi:hypothetical protein D9615_003134 [Tricholomella constricta]|uniref:Uncharacterized protein n=1 Tax=Tricholomella constricta TaxID=117010 RepID=A0A8H5HJR4_9AGAR|nr:hypothetical protein D9615_003134 [Tricholomella constricta]